MAVFVPYETHAASFSNPDPEVVTGTVTLPSGNLISDGGFESYGWVWSSNTSQNTSDKLEGSCSLDVKCQGG